MKHKTDEGPEANPERLIFISDGVFAVAMTLAAVELVSADLHERLANEGTFAVLRAMAPRFIGVAVTFMIVGVYWMSHQRMFSRIIRVDRRLTILNLYFLLGVTLMPFAVQLTSLPRPDEAATAAYGALVGMLGFLLNRIWAHAAGAGRLVDPSLDARDIRAYHYRTLITAGLFLASAPAAWLVGPLWARTLWGAALFSGRAASYLTAKAR